MKNYSKEEIKKFLKDRKCLKCSSKVKFLNTDSFNDKLNYHQCGNCKEFYTYVFPGMGEEPKMVSESQEEFKQSRTPEFVDMVKMQVMQTLYKRSTPSGNFTEIMEKAPEDDNGVLLIPASKYEIPLMLVFRTIAEVAIKYKFSTRELSDLISFVFDTEIPTPDIKKENIFYYSFFGQIFGWIGRKYKFLVNGKK